MINIGTVFVGDKFDDKYLKNLFAMLKRNIDLDFRLYCITDRVNRSAFSSEIVFIDAQPGIWGWWHYMYYYSGRIIPPGESVAILGLDTVIRGNITSYSLRSTLTYSRDFQYLIGNKNPSLSNTYADCFAIIPPNGIPWLFNEFIIEHNASSLGATRATLMHVWVTKQLQKRNIAVDIWQDIAPELMTSFKWPSEKEDEPSEPLVFWHGAPMLHESAAKIDWIKKHWRE